jgi:two-component system sensor histidine kinase/response regulator
MSLHPFLTRKRGEGAHPYPKRGTMKIHFINAVLVTQVLLSVAAIVAVWTGASTSILVVALIVICYLIGLGALLWYSLMWKEEAAVAVPPKKEQAAAPTASSTQRLGQMKNELDEAKREILELKKFKSDFLAHISHEIRTPLNAVVGMAELLSRTEMTSEQQELVSLVSSSGETLLSVINDILNYSKMESGEFVLERNEFELSELIEGSAQLLNEQARLKDVSLTTFVSPRLKHSYIGDAARLRQILLNLLGNAVRFAQKGEILVSAVEDSECKGGIRFTVKDSSLTMSNSIVASLFTPMTEVDMITARKHGGTGLGLSVTKKLVELMHGKMGIDADERKGTVYWFSVLLEPVPKHHEPVEQEMVVRSEILLVGKASSSAAVVMAYSKSWGIDCEYCPSTEDALQLLLTNPSNFQAVITEPQTNDTEILTFLKRLFEKEELSEIQVIVLTEDEQTDQAVKKLGYTLQTLRKPFKKAHLREALRQCHLKLRRTGELVQPESQLKSFIASVEFATRDIKDPSNGRVEVQENKPDLPRILIVEDNPVNRRLVHLQLKTFGLDCHIVENGREAVDAVERAPYDLIFMDCWMPVMDGFSATENIRQAEAMKRHRTVIVAMTANAMDTDRDECLTAGMDDYISKPVTRVALQAVIDRWLPKRLKFDTHTTGDQSSPNKRDKPGTNSLFL